MRPRSRNMYLILKYYDVYNTINRENVFKFKPSTIVVEVPTDQQVVGVQVMTDEDSYFVTIEHYYNRYRNASIRRNL